MFFDNYFSGYELFRELSNLGKHSEKIESKRGPLKSQNFLQKKNHMIISLMTLLKYFLFDGLTISLSLSKSILITHINCWLNAIKLKVPQTHLIANYNKYMGGVNPHDCLTGKYGISVRRKK